MTMKLCWTLLASLHPAEKVLLDWQIPRFILPKDSTLSRKIHLAAHCWQQYTVTEPGNSEDSEARVPEPQRHGSSSPGGSIALTAETMLVSRLFTELASL